MKLLNNKLKVKHLKYEIIDKMDLIDICRKLYPSTAKHTFFSASHWIFSKILHILGHKASIKAVFAEGDEKGTYSLFWCIRETMDEKEINESVITHDGLQ